MQEVTTGMSENEINNMEWIYWRELKRERKLKFQAQIVVKPLIHNEGYEDLGRVLKYSFRLKPVRDVEGQIPLCI